MAKRIVSQGLVIPKANPGTTWAWIIALIVAVLKPVFVILTPTIRTELEKLLVAFYKKAVETPNPWDDFLAEFLLKIMGFAIPTG